MMRTTLRITTLMAITGTIAACSPPPQAEPTLTPTAIPSPTSADTPKPTQSITPTSTPLPPTPTEGPTVLPRAISGTVRMLSDQSQPFATSLELRLADSFELVQRTKTNSVGEFTFLDIPAVKYEVWALISANNAIPSGCGDILVNSGSFRIGIEFGPDKGLTSENPSVTVALLLISNINSPDLVATGIYAVTDVQIEEEVGTYLDIPLFCE